MELYRIPRNYLPYPKRVTLPGFKHKATTAIGSSRAPDGQIAFASRNAVNSSGVRPSKPP
jgi:hypothetical protein